MKNIWQILTLLLALALVILTIKLTIASKSNSKEKPQDQTQSLNKEQAAIDVIMTRSSVRSYTTDLIPADKMETILKAGMAAPTAGNRQPWELIVVDKREILDAIPEFIPGAHMAKRAQQAIVVCGSPAKSLVPEYWVQDCSAVTENILLAAHAMGLGAVWCGAYPNNEADKVSKMQKLLSLPEGIFALSVIVVGYPDTEPHVKDKWNPEKVHYNNWDSTK